MVIGEVLLHGVVLEFLRIWKQSPHSITDVAYVRCWRRHNLGHLFV